MRPVTRLGMLACLLLLGLLAALAVPWMYARAAIPKPPSAERLSAATRQQVGAAYVVARWRPRSAERVGGLARIYHANLFHAEAERCYELAERLASQDYRWPYLRAVLAETRSAQDVALTLLMKVVSLRSDYAAAWVRLGNIQFKGNRLPEAAAAYEQARQMSPQDPHARLGLARVALGRGATDEARGVLEALASERPRFGPAHRLLAEIHTTAGRTAEAEAHVAMAKACAPLTPLDDPVVDVLQELSCSSTFLLKEAELASRAGREDRKERLLRRAVEVAPDDVDAHMQLAAHYTLHNLFMRAAECYRTALRLEPGNAEAHYRLGGALGRLGQPGEALSHFREAIRLQPHHAPYHNNLGLILAQQGQADAAIACFRRALELDPTTLSAKVLNNLANALAQQGRIPEAIEHLRKAVQTEPSNGSLHINLSRLLAQNGQFGDALQALRDGLSAAPDHPAILTTLAKSLVACPDAKLRNEAEALRAAERACQLTAHDNPSALEALAVAQAANGRFDEAVVTARRALQIASARGMAPIAQRLEADLRRYEQRQPAVRSYTPESRPSTEP